MKLSTITRTLIDAEGAEWCFRHVAGADHIHVGRIHHGLRGDTWIHVWECLPITDVAAVVRFLEELRDHAIQQESLQPGATSDATEP